MTRAVLAVAASVLLGCTSMPKPADAGACAGLEVALGTGINSLAEGRNEFLFDPTERGLENATLIASLSPLPTRFEQPFSRLVSWEVELSTGDYELVVEVRCNGELVRVQRTPVHVSPRVVLSQWVPRECWVMHPTNSDAVDCGGIVVDQTGAAVSDAAVGSWSQPFSLVDGGWGRWVVTDAGIQRAVDGERTARVDFPETWFLATDTFAYTTGRVAILRDGGLSAYALDAGPELDGPDFVPCAASGTSVAWCEIPLLNTGTINPFARWVVCEIAPDIGGVGACTRGTGAFVRQDLRTQRVTFQGTERFVQVDLAQPERVLAERAVRVEEWLGVSNHGSGPFQLRRCNERCAFLFPDPSLETFVVDRVERWYPSATSEFVWRVEDGGTRYSRLR